MEHIYELIGLGLLVLAVLWFRHRPRIEKAVPPLLAQTLPPPRRLNLSPGPTQKKPIPSRKDLSNSSEHIWLQEDGDWARATPPGERPLAQVETVSLFEGYVDDSCEVKESDSGESETNAPDDSCNDTSSNDSSSSSVGGD